MAFTNQEVITISPYDWGVTVSDQLIYGPDTSVFNIEIKDAAGNNLPLPMPGGGTVTIEVSETPENFASTRWGVIDLRFAEYDRPYVSQGVVRFVRVTIEGVDPADAAYINVVINQTS